MTDQSSEQIEIDDPFISQAAGEFYIAYMCILLNLVAAWALWRVLS